MNSIQFITGVTSSYYPDEESAASGAKASYVETIHARHKHDGWEILRQAHIPSPDVPPQLRLAVARMIGHFSDMLSVGSDTLGQKLSLKDAFNMVKEAELNPHPMPGLPVIRQVARPENAREHWRNIPEPQ